MNLSRLATIGLILTGSSLLIAQDAPEEGVRNGSLEEWSNHKPSSQPHLNPTVVGDIIPSGWHVMQYPPQDAAERSLPPGIVAQDTTEKHGGEYSIRLEGTEGSGILQFVQRFPVAPNKRYSLRFWAKAEDLLSDSRALKVLVRMGPLDPSADFHKAAKSKMIDVDPHGGSFDWTEFDIPLEVGEDSLLEVNFQTSASSGKLRLDDIEIVPLD